MNPVHHPDVFDFRPGDRVKVIDGTFAGSEGRVIDMKEAREMLERGGQRPGYRTPTECMWVALRVFGRIVPIELHRFQVRHAE